MIHPVSRTLGLAALVTAATWLSSVAAVAATGTLLDQFRAGPMAGVDDVIFAARKINETDGHWYANLGYYAHDPNRKAWREGGKLYRWNVATGKLTGSEDVNNDGTVNIGDVVVIGLHWGETW